MGNVTDVNGPNRRRRRRAIKTKAGALVFDENVSNDDGSQVPSRNDSVRLTHSSGSAATLASGGVGITSVGDLSLTAAGDTHITSKGTVQTTSEGSVRTYAQGNVVSLEGKQNSTQMKAAKKMQEAVEQIEKAKVDKIKSTKGEEVPCPTCGKEYLVNKKSGFGQRAFKTIRKYTPPYFGFAIDVLEFLYKNLEIEQYLFFSKKKSFKNVRLKEVLSHPKWKMGKNNLIDSSNFINKILEIYEVSIIYNIPISKIDFIISRQAFIHSIVFYKDGVLTLNGFKNDMLLTLIHPLNEYFIFKEKINSEKLLKNLDNFQLSNNLDKRFIFFNYYKKMREFNHEKLIIFLLLNNYAQSLYLSNKLKYDQIIPYTMKNIEKFKNASQLNNIPNILKFIELIRNQIQND